MNFSLVLASRERVPILTKFMETLVQNTQDISNIEVLVGIDYDDHASCAAESHLLKEYPFMKIFRRQRSQYLNQDYLNWLCQFSSGKYIIACNDDIEVRTKNWDSIAIASLDKYLADKPDGVVYGFIEDGLENRYGMDYCCFPLFSRKAYNTLGWLLPGCFMSWNADIAAWRVYKAVDRVCHIPVMFNHVSFHTGQRERDHISYRMEKLSDQSRLNGGQYNIEEDVAKLNAVLTLKSGVLPVGRYGITYSFLVPTRERPDMLEALVNSIENNTINKKTVEICIGYDSDDKKTASVIGKLNRRFGSLVRFYGKQRSSMINRDYINWLCKFSNGSFLIPCDDDCVLMEYGWDEVVSKKLQDYLADKPDGIVFGKTNDGHGKQSSTRFPLVSRAAVEKLGYVLHPDFPSWGSETHLMRVYDGVGRVLDLVDNMTLEHISYHTGKREKDSVNMHIERQAYRTSQDSVNMDIAADKKLLQDHIKATPSVLREQVVKNKVNVLFVTEKWCDGNPAAGETNSFHNLMGSLEVSELANYECLHFDEYYINNKKNADEELLRICQQSRPDVIVGSYLPHPAHTNINSETWAKVKEMGIPIVFMWFDTIIPFIAAIADSLAPYSTVSIALDTSDPQVSNKDKFLSLWTPQDTRHFFNAHAVRDIDVCFLGSMHGYTDRIVGVEALKYNGIEVMQMGGQRERPLSLEAYVNVLQRAKICLNFAKHRGQPFVQAKGRIFEATLCGALLMDADNSQTKKWYSPGEHYISFKDERDLVEKVKHYLNNDGERGSIAQAGWLKASTSYTPRNFWKAVFERAGV